jgi:hypothetical protein
MKTEKSCLRLRLQIRLRRPDTDFPVQNIPVVQSILSASIRVIRG